MQPARARSNPLITRAAAIVLSFAAMVLANADADQTPVRLPPPPSKTTIRHTGPTDSLPPAALHPKITGFTPESKNPPKTFEPKENTESHHAGPSNAVDALPSSRELANHNTEPALTQSPITTGLQPPDGNQPRWLPSTVGTHPVSPSDLDAGLEYPTTASALTQPLTVHLENEPPAGATSSDPNWWAAEVVAPAGIAPAAMPISIDGLVQASLIHSVQVRALRTEPEIRRATIAVESSAFDWTTFVESRFDDTSDPIGSLLQTGAVDGRYIDQTWAASAGLRRTNRLGGKTEITQNGGHQRNNSEFLVPNPQGTTRLELNYTQPLLSGGGTFVNESRIVVAKLDFQATDHRTAARIQNHLIEVTTAYWDLYLARSLLFQKRKLLASAIRIYQTLAAREGVDVLRRQILRAQVAVTSREAEVIRTQTEIRNAQARLKRLVNDPALASAMTLEWTPQDHPLVHRIDVSPVASAQIAVATRPEIAATMRRVKSLSVQAEVARNDLLPRLDLLLRTYVAGLEDRADTVGSWKNQWVDGRPTYGAGLLYEFPLGNRAAEGRLRRSRWELAREIYQLESTIEQTLLEVDIAVRETQTAYREMISKERAVAAATAETQYLDERFRTLPTSRDSAVLLLENLLDAQQRVGIEEENLATASVNYAKSWVALRRAMGTLLQVERPANSINGSPIDAARSGMPAETRMITGPADAVLQHPLRGDGVQP